MSASVLDYLCKKTSDKGTTEDNIKVAEVLLQLE